LDKKRKREEHEDLQGLTMAATASTTCPVCHEEFPWTAQGEGVRWEEMMTAHVDRCLRRGDGKRRITNKYTYTGWENDRNSDEDFDESVNYGGNVL